MKMRKSIATKNNFLTGEQVEFEKIKPEQLARGITTIQLFDEKGELVEESKAENFVAQPMIEWQRELMRLSFFGYSYSTNGIASDADSSSSRMHDYENVFRRQAVRHPLRYLILTDHSGPEKPSTERLLKGTMTGWADKTGTYSGSDSQRGTLNPSESFASQGQMHYVFDFPTHAANGTFSSVYFASESSLNHYSKEERLLEITNEVMPEDLRGDVVRSNSRMKKIGSFYYIYMYGTNAGGYIGKYNIDVDSGTIELVDSWKIGHTGSSVYDWCLVGNVMIVSYGYNSFYAYNKDGSPNNSFFSSYQGASKSKNYIKIDVPEGYHSSDTNYGAVMYVDESLYFIPMKLKKTSADNYSNYLWRYEASTGTLLSVSELKGWPANSSSAQLQYDPTYNALVVSDESNWYWYDMSTNSFTANLPRACKFKGSCLAYTDEHNGLKVAEASSGDEWRLYLYKQKLGAIATRNLLPSAVTKTSTNTMKITYDFFFEPVPW